MTDHRWTVVLLWVTLAASLAASWAHLAQLFARYEAPDSWWIGAIAATAVDLGILASMKAVGELAAAGRSTRQSHLTVAGLVVLSCVANAAHALAMGRPSSTAEAVLAVGAAGALPVIVWRLALLLDEVKRPVAKAATPDYREAVTRVSRAASFPDPLVRVDGNGSTPPLDMMFLKDRPPLDVTTFPATRTDTAAHQREVARRFAEEHPGTSLEQLARASGVGSKWTAKRRLAEWGIVRDGRGQLIVLNEEGVG